MRLARNRAFSTVGGTQGTDQRRDDECDRDYVVAAACTMPSTNRDRSTPRRYPGTFCRASAHVSSLALRIVSAAHNDNAARVSVGFAVAAVGNTPLPTKNRLG